MPIEAEVQLKLDERGLTDVKNNAEAVFAGLGAQLGKDISHGMVSELNTIGPRFVHLGSIAEGALGSISAGAILAAAGVAGIGVTAFEVGKHLYDLGATFDSISDNLVIRTGKAGAELDALNTTVTNIGENAAVSLEKIGDIVAQVSVGLDLAGQPLTDVAERLAVLSSFGQDIDVRKLSQDFNVFNQTGEQTANDLDALFTASQRSLAGINELTSAMAAAGPAAKSLGLNFGETLNLMVTMEKGGIDPARTFMALTNAAKVAADTGLNLNSVLRDTINYIRTADQAAAVDVAGKIFGERNAERFVSLIKDGKLTADTLTQSLDNTYDSIDKAKSATDDWKEQWIKLKTHIEAALKPIAEVEFGKINKEIEFLEWAFGKHGAPWPGGTGGTPPPLTPSATTPGPQQPIPGIMIPPDASSGGMELPPGPLPGTTPDVSPGGSASPFNVPPPPPLPEHLPAQDVPEALDRRKGGAGSTSKTGAPAVPMPAEYGQPPRPGETIEDWQHRQRVLEAENNVAEQKARLAQMEAANNDADEKNNFTQDEITKERTAISASENRLYALEHENIAKRRQNLDEAQVPYPAGFGAAPRPGETAEQYGREQSAYEAIHRREQAEAQLAQIRNDPQSSPDAIVKAENAVASARQNEYETLLRLTDATRQGTNQLQDFGAKIDADFGASQGLPGLAENLTKFLANLAFAPVFGAMGGAQAATGVPGSRAGSGIVGMIANAAGIGQQSTGTSTGPFGQIGTGSLGQISAGPFGQIGVGPFGINPQQGQAAAQAASRQLYGLPAGTDIRQGAAGFPDWVYELGGQFNLQASTYAGHQQTNRPDIGALPNPQGLNRGIDWWGSQSDMDRFSQYLIDNGLAEQVIHMDPSTGKRFGYPANVDYSGNYGDETTMVHTRFGQSPGIAQPAGRGIRATRPGANWDAIAQKESSGNWQIPSDNQGRPFRGGLQILDSTWRQYGGLQYGPTANLATKDQQIAVAENILKGQGPGAWPNTFVPGFQEGGPVPGGGKTANVEPPPWAPDWGYGTTSHGASPDWGGDVRLPYLDENAPDSGPYFKLPGLWQSQWGEKIPNWWYPGLIPGMWRVGGPFGPGPTPRQEGGPIPGAGEVPIVAHEGEHVLTSKDVNAMGGQQGVYDFRAGLHQPKAGPPTPPMTPGAVMPTFGGTLGGPMPAISPIGAVAPSAGHGAGFSVTGGGLVGIAESVPATAVEMAISAAAAAHYYGGAVERYADGGEIPSVLGPSGGGGIASAPSGAPAGGPPGGSLISAAINIGMAELNNAIGYGGRAIGAVVSGLQQTFGPDQFAQSKMGQQSWVTRFVGGIMGAQPQLPNLAGMMSQPPPPTPSIMQGTGPFAGTSGKSGGPLVNIENYHANAGEDRAGADIARHTQAAYTESSLTGSR